MFSVKKSVAFNKTIRMPIELIEKLEKIAAQNDISFNKLVIQCCEYALSNMKDERDQGKES